MRILSFDPGFDRLGAAVIERDLTGKESLMYSDCLTTHKSDEFAIRLKHLGLGVLKLIKTYHPDIVAIEKLFISKNQKTAMQVSEVRGMLIYLAASHDIPLREFTPLEVKLAITGNGKSEKRQVAYMVKRLLPLPDNRRLDDEYDAIAIGLTALAVGNSKHIYPRTK